MTSIGIIGAGNMGKSIALGLIAKGFTDITISDPNIDVLNTLKKNYPIHTTSNNKKIIEKSIVLLAIKPQLTETVLINIHDDIQQHQPLIISIMAGISCATLQRYCGDNIAIIRAMPNLPAQIHCGITALFSTPNVSSEQQTIATQLFESIGEVVWVKKENDINAVTAVAGSGPAYYFLLQEILETCAIELGLTPDIAKQLVTQTAWGATQMVKHSNKTAAELRQQVTSPNGTTAAALSVLNDAKLTDIFQRALLAANHRAITLSEEH